jgi:hypothetical protein
MSDHGLGEGGVASDSAGPAKLPVFPFVPSAIEYGSFYPFVYGDFSTADGVGELVQLLWQKPETAVFYYWPVDKTPEQALEAAEANGDVFTAKIERMYYPHPKHVRDFMHISPDAVKAHPEWYGDIVKAGHEHWRSTLKLSHRKRTQLDTLEKIRIEDEIREQQYKNHYKHDVFLSYAAPDHEQASRLHSLLEASGARVFMARKNLDPGDDFAEEIRRALGMSRELWLVASPSSLTSEWVMTEWGAAWAFGTRIVPVLHRRDIKELPERLQRLHCIDAADAEGFIKERFGRKG